MTPPEIDLGYRRPAQVKQLQTGSPTSAADCGPSAALVVLQAGTRGAIRVSHAEQAHWIAALRRQMTHFPFWPATSLPNHEEAVESSLIEGTYLGVGRKRPGLMLTTASHDLVIEQLKGGHPVIVAIDYGYVNDHLSALSGSPTFRGGHFVAMVGWAEQNGVAWTLLADSLHDGRRAGIPRGWQTVRVKRYLQAAEPFGTPAAGNDHAKVGILIGGGQL